jgi:hypothetical protein
MKVTFYYGIGFANASHEETFDYEDDVTDQELQQDFDDWVSNFVDGGFYREGE